MNDDLYRMAACLLSTNIVQVLDDICSGADYSKITDSNIIVEIYYAQQLIPSNLSQSIWDSTKLPLYRENISRMSSIIGKYMSSITDDNWGNILQETRFENKASLIDIFSIYKAYKRVSGKTIRNLLENQTISLYHILTQRTLVSQYSDEISQYMKSTPETAELLLTLIEKDGGDSKKLLFPQALSKEDKTSILESYIDWDNANPNYIKLIKNSSGNSSLKISDELKNAAQIRYNQMMDELFKKHPGIEYGIYVRFNENQTEVSNCRFEGNDLIASYSTRWIDSNPDFPTLLNNFIYVFGYVDSNFRSSFPAKKSELGIAETGLGVRGEREYTTGFAHQQFSSLYSLQMRGYCQYLNDTLGIDFEQIFKWFFNIYLSEEFNIDGFVFNASSEGTTTLEKIRNLASEIDGILKQFKLYCKHKHINRDLIIISSEHVPFEEVPSLVSSKYVYSGSAECQNIGRLLCSDQALLNYTPNHKGKYRNFLELVHAETLSFAEFFPFQRENILLLADYGTISIENGIIIPNPNRMHILKELYENDVICLHHVLCEDIRAEIEAMILAGELRTESTLFSTPEAQYLNYMLNKKEFSNGLDLRNRYIHSSYPLDDRQKLDYIELLKIMVLIIIKINDDICTSIDSETTFVSPAT